MNILCQVVFASSIDLSAFDSAGSVILKNYTDEAERVDLHHATRTNRSGKTDRRTAALDWQGARRPFMQSGFG